MDDKVWAAYVDETYGGADTGMTLTAGAISATRAYANKVVIDGFGCFTHQGAGINYTVELFGSGRQLVNQMVYPLWNAQSANTYHGDSKQGLAIQMEPASSALLFRVAGTMALNDYINAAIWGHYVPVEGISEPAPVTVQEFHLFRPKAKTGVI